MIRPVTPLLVLLLALALASIACGLSAPVDGLSLTAAPSSSPTLHVSATVAPAQLTQTAEAYFAQQTETVRKDLELRIEQANAEATLIAAQVRSTQLAAQQTAMVAATQGAQTQVAYAATQQSIQATQSANATSTTVAIAIINAQIAGTQAAATSTAQVQQAQQAFAGTATQGAFYSASTVEAASVAALSTAQAARARDAEAAAERVEMTNSFIGWLQALAPILAVIVFAVIVYVVGWMWWRINKTKVLHPNSQGAYPMIYDNGRVLNAGRAFGPVVDPEKPYTPQDETIQGRIALADAQVGAVRAMAAGQRPESAARRVQQMAGDGQQQQQEQLPFHIVPVSQAKLPPGLADVVDADWREETGYGSNR